MRECIKEICENRKKSEYRATHTVNPGEPLSWDEIIKKAEEAFAEDPKRKEILERIKRWLVFYDYLDQIKNGLKVNMIATVEGQPIEVLLSPGSYHDLDPFKLINIDLPPESSFYGDSAYTDYEYKYRLTT